MSQGKPNDARIDSDINALRFTPTRSDAALSDTSRLLSIIVPLYNEEQNVDPLCTQLLALAAKLPERVEIILVDDGSRDGTPAAVARWAAQDARIKSIQFRRNFGQTAAMMAGIDAAQGDILIPMDGDLQNDPADIPRLVAKLDEGFDVVSGWRKSRGWAAITASLALPLVARQVGLRGSSPVRPTRRCLRESGLPVRSLLGRELSMRASCARPFRAVRPASNFSVAVRLHRLLGTEAGGCCCRHLLTAATAGRPVNRQCTSDGRRRQRLTLTTDLVG